MKVIAWSQNLNAERCAGAGVELAPSKEALLRQADIVSLHVVLSERTRGLIGARGIRPDEAERVSSSTPRAGRSSRRRR